MGPSWYKIPRIFESAVARVEKEVTRAMALDSLAVEIRGKGNYPKLTHDSSPKH
jgi:hypothetical protein